MQISCQYQNYFDLMADQTLRNLVSEASDLDNILVSSREKDQIITVRLDAYALYGKASLDLFGIKVTDSISVGGLSETVGRL